MARQQDFLKFFKKFQAFPFQVENLAISGSLKCFTIAGPNVS